MRVTQGEYKVNDTFLKVLNHITAHYGEDVLADPVRLKAFFSDLAKDEPWPLRLAFGRCVESGAYNALKTAPDAAERISRKTALARRVRDEHGLDPALCAEALDILEAALYGTAQTAYTPLPRQQPQSYHQQPAYPPPNYTAPPVQPQPTAPQPVPPAPAKKKHTLRNVLITAGLAAVVVAVIGKNHFSTSFQSAQPEQSGTVSNRSTQPDQFGTIFNAELRSMAAECAEIVQSAVFEGFDPAEGIQRYYFIPLSVDEFQEIKGAKDELTISIVTAYATDDGVIKARRAGYKANYGMILYSENGEAVMGLADVTLKEEDIYVSYDWGTLQYSLSNRLGDIEKAIYARTGKTISLSNVQWTLNTGLSENVKTRMNKHNVNYSMTVSTDYAGRYFIVNKRENGRWYYFAFYF
jgi:hypothetical protein